MTAGALLISPDYPPTNRSSSLRAYYLAQALAEAGYTVEVLSEAPPAGAAGLVRPEGDIAVMRVAAGHRATWLAKALWRVAWMARRQRPQVIISTSGPFLAHAVAAFAKRLSPRAFWVADYRDLWASGSYYREQARTGAGWCLRQWCERWLLRHAGLITTVSQGLQNNLSRFHGREVLVFHNGYEPQAVTSEVASTDTDAIHLCHTGSLYAERTPTKFLAALDAARASYPTPVRRLRLLFAGPVDAVVAATLAGYAGRDDVAYLGTLPRAESYRLQQSCDYCLLLEDPAASLKGVLTGKVFEYIGMRKRIVAFGIAPDSEVAAILRRTGLLAFCGADPDALAAFLCELMRGTRHEAAAPDDACIAGFERAVISRAFVREIGRRSGHAPAPQ